MMREKADASQVRLSMTDCRAHCHPDPEGFREKDPLLVLINRELLRPTDKIARRAAFPYLNPKRIIPPITEPLPLTGMIV